MVQAPNIASSHCTEIPCEAIFEQHPSAHAVAVRIQPNTQQTHTALTHAQGFASQTLLTNRQVVLILVRKDEMQFAVQQLKRSRRLRCSNSRNNEHSVNCSIGTTSVAQHTQLNAPLHVNNGVINESIFASND